MTNMLRNGFIAGTPAIEQSSIISEATFRNEKSRQQSWLNSLILNDNKGNSFNFHSKNDGIITVDVKNIFTKRQLENLEIISSEGLSIKELLAKYEQNPNEAENKIHLYKKQERKSRNFSLVYNLTSKMKK